MFTLPATLAIDVVIPYGTLAQSNSEVQFATTREGIIPAGQLTVSIPAKAVQVGELVYQVRDWFSGVAIKMGCRLHPAVRRSLGAEARRLWRSFGITEPIPKDRREAAAGSGFASAVPVVGEAGKLRGASVDSSTLVEVNLMPCPLLFRRTSSPNTTASLVLR